MQAQSLWPNDAGQWRAAIDTPIQTGSSSARPLNQPGWAVVMMF
jgi:hypothetical protein